MVGASKLLIFFVVKAMTSSQIRIVFFLLSLYGTINLFSQENFNKKINKSSSLQIGHIQTRYSFKNELNVISGFSVQHSYCLVPGRKFGFGVGVGFTKYPKHTFLPLFLKVTSGINQRVFFDFQGGYSTGWKGYSSMYDGLSYRGGSYGEVGLGLKLNMKSDYKSYIKASYRFQLSELKEEKLTISHVYYNSFEVSFGILFQQ